MSEVDSILDLIGKENEGHHVITLPGSGKKVHIRPLTVKDYKIFLKTAEGMQEATNPNNVNLFKFEEVFDNVLGSCITKPADLDIKTLASSDWVYLMYKLRSVSKGNVVTFNTKCEKCEADNTTQLDLNTLDNKETTGAMTVEWKFNDNCTFLFKAPSRSDEYEIYEARNDYKIDSDYRIYKIAASLDKVEYKIDGMDNPELKEDISLEGRKKVIEKLSSDQLNEVEKLVVDKLTWGVPATFNIKCKSCGKSHEEIIMDISEFFLV